MGPVGFRGETNGYNFLLVRARSRVGLDGATPRRRLACVILADFLSNCDRVSGLSAYAKKYAYRYFGPRKRRALSMTGLLSSSLSHGSSSVNSVTHWRQEHVILVMSVPLPGLRL
jgi:hypothetical protein